MLNKYLRIIMFGKIKHQEIIISDILYNKVHKDERYEHAVLLPLKLFPIPDHRWHDLFITTYHSRFYPSKIPHTRIHGDIIYVTTFVNDSEERIKTYINIIKRAVAETNKVHKRLCEDIKNKETHAETDDTLSKNISRIAKNLKI